MINQHLFQQISKTAYYRFMYRRHLMTLGIIQSQLTILVEIDATPVSELIMMKLDIEARNEN